MAEWVEGTVERVLWASQDSGYAIVMVRTGIETFTAVGDLASLSPDGDEPGVFVSLEGSFETHPTHGRLFRVRGYLLGSPRTKIGLRLYLSSSGIRGV